MPSRRILPLDHCPMDTVGMHCIDDRFEMATTRAVLLLVLVVVVVLVVPHRHYFQHQRELQCLEDRLPWRMLHLRMMVVEEEEEEE